jgi:hypothetical protein
VTIGIPAHCLAFSPDGTHLAVGTTTGIVRVLAANELSTVVAELDQVRPGLQSWEERRLTGWGCVCNVVGHREVVMATAARKQPQPS